MMGTDGDYHDQRFELIDANLSNIHFSNDLVETDTFNYFSYPYMYMGGGVAIGDINNDGLSDIFLTGNLVSNKLYLNHGGFEFQDITVKAGVSGSRKWYAGVTFVDINADGYLDIYLCVSGIGHDKKNELYINNQDATFTEAAELYGLDDAGNSVQASFFDYDHDGDLDLYVANYPVTNFSTSNVTYLHLINTVTNENSDHLFENKGNNTFENVTEKAGLLAFGLSLSATVADFNKDGWDDIYVSSDFSTPDYFYINNGDGTFRNELKAITRQTSFYGMGTDAADVNNDGLIDLIQVDMSAPDNRRTKANMASMNPSLFWSTVNSGFHYQYMYNSLQLNRGVSNGIPIMSNAAWLFGVSSTDWSWAPLLADFDNDGWKDLFIANGTRKEINNRDYFKQIERKIQNSTGKELKLMSDAIPSEPIANFMFKNENGKKFQKVNKSWNIDFTGFSNGTSYGDLDNDGDLDIVINNIDEKAVLYKNNSSDMKAGNYLRVKIIGGKNNPLGIGAEVHVYAKGMEQVAQLNLTRGFQSSTEPYLHFGMRDIVNADSLVVMFENEVRARLTKIKTNQEISIAIDKKVRTKSSKEISHHTLFADETIALGVKYYHKENNFNDFRYQVLLPHKMSNFGPALAVGDVNGDGLDDMFVGAAVGYNGRLLVQTTTGDFESIDFQSEEERVFEDMDAMFIDLDGDADLDLYIVSGGNEYERNSSSYQDRVYLNVKGQLIKRLNVLPEIVGSGSCVRPFDYDKDGDQDLFIGGRHDPRNYPYHGQTYLLENKMENGVLKFEDVTDSVAPGLSSIGMVTDALWTDINEDGKCDLLVVGEWMPLTLFEYDNELFIDKSQHYFEGNTTGWWFSVEHGDFDKDGDDDYVFGNLGENYKYQADENEPFSMYVKDFDDNGKSDIVLSYYNYGEEYPVRGRECSSQQIPAIKVAYESYNSFSTARTVDVFGTESLNSSLTFKVESFQSLYMENLEGDGFHKVPLPSIAQLSSINDILIEDFDNDGNLDMLIGGNLFASEVETPRSDAGIGLVLIGNGKGGFEPLSMEESGVLIPYDLKKIVGLKIDQNYGFTAVSNSGPLQVFANRLSD